MTDLDKELEGRERRYVERHALFAPQYRTIIEEEQLVMRAVEKLLAEERRQNEVYLLARTAHIASRSDPLTFDPDKMPGFLVGFGSRTTSSVLRDMAYERATRKLREAWDRTVAPVFAQATDKGEG